MFVQAAYHDVLPCRRRARVPRQRFLEYQEDLHRIAGQRLDQASLLAGDQYTYAEVAEALLQRVGGEVLPGLDVLVTSYWTPEFDPDLSAFGPHLHHRWSLDCQSFDVIDHGSLSPVLGLQVLSEYLSADPEAADGVLLGVEQSTVPQAEGRHVPAPERSSAGVVRLTRRPGGGALELVAAAALTETEVSSAAFSPHALAREWCERFGILPNQLTVAMRRNTGLYRRWRYEAPACPDSFALAYLPARHSCMTLFAWLRELTARSVADAGAFLLLEEDVESLAVAAVLVRHGAAQ
jgi:hypothetical protein